MLDAIIISDLHLGAGNCQAKLIREFLERIEQGELSTAKLILNGDVFDSIDFRRLSKHHWRVLSLLRKLSDKLEIIWLAGNHDGAADIVSHLLGTFVDDDYILESGSSRILILHGHVFDSFIDGHPILTWLGDCAYSLLQWMDSSHKFARFAKQGSKTFLRCVQKIADGALEMARKRGCTHVCCGHTHSTRSWTDGVVNYYNSGCWTELPCSYLTIKDGVIKLEEFVAEEVQQLAKV